MYTCFLGTGTEKLPIETSPSSADDPTTTTTGPQSPEEAFAQAQQLLNAVSSKPQVLCASKSSEPNVNLFMLMKSSPLGNARSDQGLFADWTPFLSFD